jgi:beta-lactamase superfamily II metal-dependent hydrolase
MAYEIDYISVGDGERSGDAITLRFGNLSGSREQQFITVIDGGFQESGETLVNHIKTYYGTDHVDLAVSTHPDSDHASGLYAILEKLSVGQLAMHRPWEHAAEIKRLFKDGRITASGLEERLEKSLQHASDLETLATKKGIQIVEPFQGITGLNGAIHILGPSQEYYKILLAGFRSTPEPKNSLGILEPLRKATKETVKRIQDFWHIDLLDDDEDTTSAENNTSTIILFNLDGHKLLFTGDAGKTAILNAIAYADTLRISLTGMQFLDVPHHGSKHNLNSKILKKMNATTAFISANGNNGKHPAKKITNALQKHGAKVFVNRKSSLLHHYNAPARGWSAAIAEPFHQFVEE